MIVRRWAALLLTCASVACAQTVTPAVPADAHEAKQPGAWEKIAIPPLHPFHPQQPRRIQLDNGLVILLQEDHELPFIDGSVEMRGGSQSEPAARAGLVDLYAQTWRTSGTARQNGDALDDLLESKAAKVETTGDDDSTAVSWSCMTKDEDQVFGIVLDLLLHPAFSKDKLALAKEQEIAGIVRRNDDVNGIAGREAAKLVYGEQSPLTRQPEVSTVSAVTLADLQSWHEKTVVANNMIVAVEGDFDAAAMERTLRQAFGALPRGPAISRPDLSNPAPRPGVYFVRKSDVDQSQVWIVGSGTVRSNPDYYALSVMNEIFSGGFGSRLFQDVRTRLGLAYAVEGAYGAAYDHPGMFYTIAATRSASTVQAAHEMLQEIAALRTRPFTEDELRSAKDQLLNSFIFRYDSPEKVLNEAVELEFYHYPPDFLEKYRAAVERVTSADLERVARKYIDPSKLAVLVVGNDAQFGTPLNQLGLGPEHVLDITIPIPPSLRQALGAGN
jgi:zinc protease